VLDELKMMLNPPANDLQRVAQQLMQWDTSWDPTQVWLTSFIEEDGSVEIVGKARSNDDVAEFTVRLANSPYFSDVLLNSTRAATQTGLGAVFEFDLSAKVNYDLSAGEEG
jgi:Tfp pilus assembly protein PilN